MVSKLLARVAPAAHDASAGCGRETRRSRPRVRGRAPRRTSQARSVAVGVASPAAVGIERRARAWRSGRWPRRYLSVSSPMFPARRRCCSAPSRCCSAHAGMSRPARPQPVAPLSSSRSAPTRTAPARDVSAVQSVAAICQPGEVDAPIPHLARGLQVGQRRAPLLGRRDVVGHVLRVQLVVVVGLQPVAGCSMGVRATSAVQPRPRGRPSSCRPPSNVVATMIFFALALQLDHLSFASHRPGRRAVDDGGVEQLLGDVGAAATRSRRRRPGRRGARARGRARADGSHHGLRVAEVRVSAPASVSEPRGQETG